MSDEVNAISMLNEHFLTDYPHEAARALEAQSAEATLQVMQGRSLKAQLRCWQALSPDRAADVLDALPAEITQHLLNESDPQISVAALAQLAPARQEVLLAAVAEPVRRELRELMQYRRGTVGSLMDPRIATLGAALTVAEAIDRLRNIRQEGLRELFVVDDQMKLVGQIGLGDLLLARRERPIREITRTIEFVVRDSDPVAKVAEAMQQQPLEVLPVVSEQGRFMGAIRAPELMTVVRQQGSRWRPAWMARGSA